MLTVEGLKKLLESKFNLICFIDLADLRFQHQTIFKIFQKYYKKEFLSNERLVFYSSQEPEQEFLNHIQYAAATLDISNFFILFICPTDINDKLDYSNKKYGYDDVPMRSELISLDATKPFFENKFVKRDFLCALPFMSAEISRTGEIRPCCKYQGSMGNLNKESLQNIFNNQFYKTIRKQMIEGERPLGCEVCVSIESTGSTSLRQLMTEKYKNILDQSALDNPKVIDMSIAPSNLCNFKCRICNAHNSTSIRNEEIYFKDNEKEKNQIQKTYKIFDGSATDLIFLNPDVSPEFLHLLGGEPFMWPALPKIIDQLIASGKSKNTRIEFNTNGSIYPTYFEKIIDNFKCTEILISIDDVGERFELQRGGTWENILENLKRFAGYNGGTTIIKLTPTINIQNLLYLDDVINLAADLRVGIVWTYLETPTYLCIDNITDAVKQSVQTLYKNHPVEELRKIAHRVTLTPAADPSPFLNYTKKIDQRRNQDFYKSHQEICKLMNFQV